jgi:ABC-type molybdenum transport system ATPase subunit/photorepair protein PhrA
VAPGDRVVVHGPNGSGKITLSTWSAGGEREVDLLRSQVLGRVDQRHCRTLRPELSTLDNVALQLQRPRGLFVRARTGRDSSMPASGPPAKR